MKFDEIVYAYIYPVLGDHIERIFAGKDVFCKFTGERNLGIGVGTKILFYASSSGRKVLGEGTVDKVELLNSEQVISQYGSKLFLTEKELNDYRGATRSPKVRLLVLSLRNIKRYEPPVVLPKNLTMAGLKLSEKQYLELIAKPLPSN